MTSKGLWLCFRLRLKSEWHGSPPPLQRRWQDLSVTLTTSNLHPWKQAATEYQLALWCPLYIARCISLLHFFTFSLLHFFSYLLYQLCSNIQLFTNAKAILTTRRPGQDFEGRLINYLTSFVICCPLGYRFRCVGSSLQKNRTSSKIVKQQIDW